MRGSPISSYAQRRYHIEAFHWRFAARDHLTSGGDPRRVMQRSLSIGISQASHSPLGCVNDICAQHVTVSSRFTAAGAGEERGHHWESTVTPRERDHETNRN